MVGEVPMPSKAAFRNDIEGCRRTFESLLLVSAHTCVTSVPQRRPLAQGLKQVSTYTYIRSMTQLSRCSAD
jgi:hypothetical protein